MESHGQASVRSISMGDVARQHRRSYPSHLAVVCREVRLSYRELDDRVNGLVSLFGSRGIREGSRIVWLGQNCHRLLETLLAAAKLGAYVCPGNWRLEPDELAFVVDDVEASLVLWQEHELGAKARDVRERVSSDGAWIQHDGAAGSAYEALLRETEALDPETEIDSNLPLVQLYTASFEGTPNGALLAQSGILVYSLIYAKEFDIDDRYRYLNSGVLFHMATLQGMLATFVMAGTNVFIPRPDAQSICETVEREGINGAYIVEPTISQIVELNRRRSFALKTLRARPGNEEWNELVTVEGKPSAAFVGYGQTEVTGRLTWIRGGEQGAHGRPHPAVQVRLLDELLNEVPPGQVGEICARGPVVMLGYDQRAGINRKRMSGGWYRTNDLGRREEDGSITFLGSKGRLIKSGVENIYAREVELTLNAHPAISEAAVIGVPDAKWAQAVRAVVVPKTGGTMSKEAVLQFCRERLASYKCPRSVVFVESLPYEGKQLDYDAIDEQYGGGGYPGSESYRQRAGF